MIINSIYDCVTAGVLKWRCRDMLNLTEYMNVAIDRIIKNALKASLKNAKESTFIVKYLSAHKKAIKIRNNYDDQGIHIPPFLIASISTSCNLFCKGCYARENKSCGEGLPRNNLSLSRWNEIFEEAMREEASKRDLQKYILDRLTNI